MRAITEIVDYETDEVIQAEDFFSQETSFFKKTI